jgi:uncharacterized protein YjiK
MFRMAKILIFLLAGYFGTSAKDAAEKLKIKKQIRLKGIAEPSDIVYSQSTNTYFLLGDKAFIYELDMQGKKIKKFKGSGYDIEGSTLINDTLVVSDEGLRQIVSFNTRSTEAEKVISLSYGGASNQGFESITYIPVLNQYWLATEKSPCVFMVYNSEFQLQKQFSIKGIREVSAMTFFGGDLYVLSDEESSVYRLDYKKGSILNTWKIPVLNPEGICFNQNNEMVVVSDDMGKMYVFDNPIIK